MIIPKEQSLIGQGLFLLKFTLYQEKQAGKVQSSTIRYGERNWCAKEACRKKTWSTQLCWKNLSLGGVRRISKCSRVQGAGVRIMGQERQARGEQGSANSRVPRTMESKMLSQEQQREEET